MSRKAMLSSYRFFWVPDMLARCFRYGPEATDVRGWLKRLGGVIRWLGGSWLMDSLVRERNNESYRCIIGYMFAVIIMPSH